MTSQFIGSAYLTISVFVILLLALINQKPLCINSHLIEKITMTDNSVVYRCSVRRKVPYSTDFVQNQAIIESRIVPFENWLGQVWSGRAPRISIRLVNQPIVTQVQGREILIWDQNFKATQQLEVEIAKNYLRFLNSRFFSSNDLALQSLADFVVRIWSDNQALSYGGFSSYIAHQWWVSYSGLNAKDKFLLLKNGPALIRRATVKLFPDPETKTYDQLVQLTQLFASETNFFSRLESRKTYENNSLTAAFDFLILMPQIRPGIVQSLSGIQKRQPSLSLGTWDGKDLFHVGSKSRIAAESFRKLKVDHLIWESCDDLEFKEVLSVSADVRKLLVVRNCSPQNQPDYNQYVSKGIAGFAARHPQISFVQLDIPSLNMRRDQIVLQQKVFDQMTRQASNAEPKNTFLSLFGIERLHWDDKLQIYVPKSQIDAVESFRVFKTN